MLHSSQTTFKFKCFRPFLFQKRLFGCLGEILIVPKSSISKRCTRKFYFANSAWMHVFINILKIEIYLKSHAQSRISLPYNLTRTNVVLPFTRKKKSWFGIGSIPIFLRTSWVNFEIYKIEERLIRFFQTPPYNCRPQSWPFLIFQGWQKGWSRTNVGPETLWLLNSRKKCFNLLKQRISNNAFHSSHICFVSEP